MKNLVILGAGTAGTIMANRLAKALSPREWRITVVDRDDDHVYQPGLLFLPFGTYRAEDIVRPRRMFVSPQVDLVLGNVAAVAPDEQRVHVEHLDPLPYDVLAMKMFDRTEHDLVPQVKEVITAGDFFELSDGAQIVFT